MPFPGMDPYLEGYLWPDVHSALANKIRQQLAPQIQPKYVARLEISVIEDYNPDAEIGIMYPDVEVIKVGATGPLPTLPVPLRSPDPEAVLDLSAALRAIYDEALYHLSIDYTQDPPPPPFPPEDLAWLRTQLECATFDG